MYKLKIFIQVFKVVNINLIPQFEKTYIEKKTCIEKIYMPEN